MTEKLLPILAVALMVVACDQDQVSVQSSRSPDFHLFGLPDKGAGKVIIATGKEPGLLLLGGNHLFASGQMLEGGGWKIDVLRLEPTHEELSVQVDAGHQVFLDDQGRSEPIDGTFDLTGPKPTWTGRHTELEAVIESALESKTIAQQE